MGEPQKNGPYADELHTPGVPEQAAGGVEQHGNEQGSMAETGPVPRARNPHTDEEPDVFLDVPRLSVDEIDLQVERLRARVALQARVLDVLSLDVGADVDLDGVQLGIKGVEAEAQLKVRLGNVEAIIERVLRTIDENPQIVEAPVRALPAAAEGAAQGAGHAAEGIGRAAGDVTEGVGRAAEGAGRAAGGATEGVGRAAGGVADTAGERARGSGGSNDIGGAVPLPDLRWDSDVPEQRAPSTTPGDQETSSSDGAGSEQDRRAGADGSEGSQTAQGRGEPPAEQDATDARSSVSGSEGSWSTDGAEGPAEGVGAAGTGEPRRSGEPEGTGDTAGAGEPAAADRPDESEEEQGSGDTAEPEEPGAREAPKDDEGSGEAAEPEDEGEPGATVGSGEDTAEDAGPAEREEPGEPGATEGSGQPGKAEDTTQSDAGSREESGEEAETGEEAESREESGGERWSRIRKEAKRMRRASRTRLLRGLGAGAKQVGREVGGAASRVAKAVRDQD